MVRRWWDRLCAICGGVDRIDLMVVAGFGLVTYGVREIYTPAHAAIVAGTGLLLIVAVNITLTRRQP